MKTIKVGVIGSAGFTGGELIRILVNHPNVSIDFLHSSSNAGNPISAVHKDLIGETDYIFTDEFDDSNIDVLYLCSGHGQSMKFLEENQIRNSVKIIDLSQDFRLKNNYPRSFTYGLVEAFRDEIVNAENIANPGCFATCIQLGILPLAKCGMLSDEVHISATTGSTGAGQKPTSTTHFSWRNNNFSIYKAFEHQHLKEIRQSITQMQPGFDHEINFIPYRGNFTRGILAAMYLNSAWTESEAFEIFSDYYADSPFITVTKQPVDLKMVVNSNKGVIQVEKHGSKLLITSMIDNLIKGASGQAIQNMNIMFGLDETSGLKLKSSAY